MGSVDLPLCHLSFFDATGRCPPPRCVVFPFSDATGRCAFPSPFHTLAKHEKTPSLVSFCVQHHPFALQSMLSMKRHFCWCLFMFGVFPSPYDACLLFALLLMPSTKPHHRGCSFVFSVFPSPYNACRAGNNTIKGVVSCSVPSPCPTMHAEHSACLLAIIETMLVFGVSFFLLYPLY